MIFGLSMLLKRIVTVPVNNAAEMLRDIAKGEGVVVAVLDSGGDTDHPDLRMNIWINIDEVAGDGIDNDNNGFIDDINGWDFVADDFDPNPKFNEGFPQDIIEFHIPDDVDVIETEW